MVIPVKTEDAELNSSKKLYLNDRQIVPVHVIDEIVLPKIDHNSDQRQ